MVTAGCLPRLGIDLVDGTLYNLEYYRWLPGGHVLDFYGMSWVPSVTT